MESTEQVLYFSGFGNGEIVAELLILLQHIVELFSIDTYAEQCQRRFGEIFQECVFDGASAFGLLFEESFQFCILCIVIYLQLNFSFFEREASQHLQVFQINTLGYSVIQRIGIGTQQTGGSNEHVDVSVLLLHLLESSIAVDTVFFRLFQ